ncbi:phosphopantetheine-binding protein [Streptomyces sp. NPDC047315]|uniref:phosphopantetheine-binding protein n=1 Tax=Streptomyces sp. NPDC047315 TaxID=3155142 RepID=UPI0033C237A1
MITIELVCERIAKKLGSKASTVTLDADTTFSSIGLSSLQIADIVYGIEDDFDIQFDESRAAGIKTVGELVKLAEETTRDSSAA